MSDRGKKYLEAPTSQSAKKPGVVRTKIEP